MTIQEGNEIIARGMGYIYKTDVDIYNYDGYSYSWIKKSIFSNIIPILDTYKLSLPDKKIFDPFYQKEGFRYTYVLNYFTNYESLMEVVEYIENLRYSTHNHYDGAPEAGHYLDIKNKGIMIVDGNYFNTKKEAIWDSLVRFFSLPSIKQ